MRWLVHRACQRCGRRFSVQVGPMEPLSEAVCDECAAAAPANGICNDPRVPVDRW